MRVRVRVRVRLRAGAPDPGVFYHVADDVGLAAREGRVVAVVLGVGLELDARPHSECGGGDLG